MREEDGEEEDEPGVGQLPPLSAPLPRARTEPKGRVVFDELAVRRAKSMGSSPSSRSFERKRRSGEEGASLLS